LLRSARVFQSWGWLQIDKDVRRTHPDYHFFTMTGDELTPHHHAIMRILFIYAKLNPGIKYVQGACAQTDGR
jgi:hypothetical protein